MSPIVVRQCLEAQPFASFVLNLVDHSDFRVESAAEANLTADGSALNITRRDLNMYIALDQIVSIVVDVPRSNPFGFGS
jgi:ribosome-associated translation inhibitor RaiA